MTRTPWWIASLVALGLTACDGDDPGESGADGGPLDAASDAAPPVTVTDGGLPIPAELPTARFALADDAPTTPLGDVPFPSDLYRTAGGAIDLRGFPQQRQDSILERIVDAIEDGTDGFGTSATLYMAFEGTIDPTALPADGAASIADDSALMLVDIDPGSAERGRMWPITWRISPTATLYLPDDTLAVRLVEGAALRPTTTYALVATTAAADPAPDFAATMADGRPDGALGAAWDVHAPLRAWAAEAGVELASAAVFTTQDTVGELFRARDYLHTLPAPGIVKVETQGIQQQLYEHFTGTYRAPRFQQGEPPYRTPATGPGTFAYDGDGNPVVQGDEEIRFSLSVPVDAGEMPANGWPVVLYGHGTGGDYLSYISARVAASLAPEGIAVLSIDQIHHGTRDPRELGCQDDIDYAGCVGASFFNFIVPGAGRDNVRQSALDFVSLLRLAQNFEIDAAVSANETAVRLDPDNVMFMGHSQGGINGPLFLAVEPLVKAGMLSAAGATIAISVEQKRRPVDIPTLIREVLPLGENEPFDRWHPTLMLLQTFIEKGDPVNYARFWFDEPPAGFAPKSIFMTGGLQDDYTPPDAIFALAAAGGVPVLDPVSYPIPLFEIFGIDGAGVPPVRNNVAGGAASAGVAQYPNLGHFIIQDSVSARSRYRQFLRSVVDGQPEVY